MPEDIWLAGDENIHLISDLLQPKEERWPNDPGRQTGRTKKLALQYALLALKTPRHRIVLADHFDDRQASYRLQTYVTKILDALGVDYQTGCMQEVYRDPDSFTGVTSGFDRYFVIALPVIQS